VGLVGVGGLTPFGEAGVVVGKWLAGLLSIVVTVLRLVVLCVLRFDVCGAECERDFVS
jgi:hypothetical protein